jgi:hypothetical protein
MGMLGGMTSEMDSSLDTDQVVHVAGVEGAETVTGTCLTMVDPGEKDAVALSLDTWDAAKACISER